MMLLAGLSLLTSLICLVWLWRNDDRVLIPLVLLVTLPDEITPEENERRFRECLRLINSITHEQLVELMGEEFLEEYRRIAQH
jgi:hypothetical protein